MEQRRGAVGTAVQYVQDDGWAARSLLVREGRGRACQQGHHGWTGRGPMGASARCASATQPSTAGERGGPARLGMNLGSAGEAEGEARAGGWNGTGVGNSYATIHSRGSSWDDGWDARINFIGVRALRERTRRERTRWWQQRWRLPLRTFRLPGMPWQLAVTHAVGGRGGGGRATASTPGCPVNSRRPVTPLVPPRGCLFPPSRRPSLRNLPRCRPPLPALHPPPLPPHARL